MGKAHKIGYLLSKYPVFEQTFITREIRALRTAGFNVLTCSLRRPKDHELKSDAERDEYDKAFYIQSSGPLFIMISHLRLIVTAPLAYVATLLYALQLSPGGIKALLWQFFYFVEAGCLIEWTRRNDVNHVHVHIAQSACSVALIASMSGRISYSVTAHGPYIFYNCDKLYLSEKFSKAAEVVCISDYCRSQVMRLTPAKHWTNIRTVRLGVDVTMFQRFEQPVATNDKISILCVARLTPTKGQRLLIQACVELKANDVPFECVLVGDGPDREALERLVATLDVEDNVKLAGGVGEDAVKEFCRKADIFILPSFAEGVPVVLMEAMAMELPVISTRIMGIPELVEDGVNGLLVSPGHVGALAAAIGHLLADPQLRRRLGRAGREKVLTDYNLKFNVKKLAQVLHQYCASALQEKIGSTAITDEVET